MTGEEKQQPQAAHEIAPHKRFAQTRFELGSHIDAADLEAGKYTPEGQRVPKEQRAKQAKRNREWLAAERARLEAAKGAPEAYATLAAGDETAPLDGEELERFLATRQPLENAGEQDLHAKAERAQQVAQQLAEEFAAAQQQRDWQSEAAWNSPDLPTHRGPQRPQDAGPVARGKPKRERFLPTTRADMEARGWERCDFILVSGDAYVDHPSFANAVIARVLEWAGFKVGMIAQPRWQDTADIERLGRPRLAFLVGAGNLDSMLNAYTAHKLPRSDDPYSPGGDPNARPHRATIVYCNLIRRAFGKVPLIIGGIEASQRRFSHYDYWSDAVRRSILLDSNADLLCYGMAEQQIVEVAHRLASGEHIREITDVRGTAYVRKDVDFLRSEAYTARFGEPVETLPHEELLPPKGSKPERVQEKQPELAAEAIPAYRRNYAQAFKVIYDEQDPVRGRPILQRCNALHVVQLPPARLQSEAEMDRWYDLPYTRTCHPDYEGSGGIPAYETTKHSIITHRGCAGACTFCAIWMHQGRTVQSRSVDSIVRETEAITQMPDFKGTLDDVGGPTANMYGNYCSVQQTVGSCQDRDCLLPDPCPALRQHIGKQLEMLERVRNVPGVKRAFIQSGIRYDMLIDEKTAGEDGERYIENLAANHTSGHLKVAPEHTCDVVLERMRKPSFAKYEIFKQRFIDASKRVGKEQYMVAYFVSSHPGSTMDEQIRLAEYFRKQNWTPEQVQDFIPTPMTPATAMFYSGYDPENMELVYVPTTMREKRRQRALMQSKRPEFHGRVRKALREAGRADLIGQGKGKLVPEGRSEDWDDDHPGRPAGIGDGPKSQQESKRPYRKHKPHKGAPVKPARGAAAKAKQRRQKRRTN